MNQDSLGSLGRRSWLGRVTRCLPVLLCVALAACDALPRFGKRGQPPVAAPPPQHSMPDAGAHKRSRTPGAPARGSGMSLVGHCDQREIDGYSENARLDLSNGTVRELSWHILIGKRGSCRFNGNEFRQTKRSPVVEMLARDGSGCKLMVWGDPRRITLAHAGCARFCSPGVYDRAWPVMFDPGTGRCADTER